MGWWGHKVSAVPSLYHWPLETPRNPALNKQFDHNDDAFCLKHNNNNNNNTSHIAR